MKMEYVVSFGRKSSSAYGEWTSWIEVGRADTLIEMTNLVFNLVTARKHVIRIALTVDGMIRSEVKLERDFYESMDSVNEIMGYVGLQILKGAI